MIITIVEITEYVRKLVSSKITHSLVNATHLNCCPFYRSLGTEVFYIIVGSCIKLSIDRNSSLVDLPACSMVVKYAKSTYEVWRS